MPRPLTVTITGRDETGPAFRSATDNAQQFSTRMVAMGTAVGTAMADLAVSGVRALGGQLKGMITDAQESARVGRLTEAVIKSTGGAAKITANQVGDLATAISNKTGMDDEAIQSGANLLLTFKNVRNEVGKNNDIFNRATQAAADLSAAGFGDLSGASKQLGKALNDPIKGMSALSKSGVTFTEQQKKQIKTLVESGKVLDAQKIILAEVESQVGGAAAAAGDPMKKLQVTIGNLREELGGALLPTVNRVADGLRGFIAGVQGQGQVEGFSGKLHALGVTVRNLVVAFQRWRDGPGGQALAAFITNRMIPAVTGLWGWVQQRLAPAVRELAGARLGALRDAFRSVQNAVEKNRPQLEALWRVFRLVADVLVTQVMPLLGRVANEHLRALGTAIGGVITGIGWFVRALRGMLNTALAVFGAIVNGAAKAFSWLPGINRLTARAARAFNKFRDDVNRSLDGVAKSRTITVTARGQIIFPDGRAISANSSGRGYQRAAAGGFITGPGGPTEDRIPAWLSNGEYVVNARATRENRALLEQINARRYAQGGLAIKANTLTEGFNDGLIRMTNSMVQAIGANAGKAVAAYAPKLTGGVGWQMMMAALRKVFPGLALISGFRPGAITATGNPSYHGKGRATDLPPRMDVFNWIAQNYGAQTRELIFSPAGGRQIWNGRPHTYTGITRANHWDHVHWAMANGGVIREPMLGVGLRSGDTYSLGERGPETVTPGVGGAGDIVIRNVMVVDGRVLAESQARYDRRGGRIGR